MKKLLLAATAIVGLGFLASCALQQSPLSPSTTLIGAANALFQGMATPVVDSNPNTLAGSMVIYFQNGSKRIAMDPTTINSSTVLVYYKTTDTAETQFTAVTVSYDTTLQEVSITPTSMWSVNTRYRVELTTGIRTAAGSAMDGNGNNIAEAATFDNWHTQFSFDYGSLLESAYTFGALTPTNVTVRHEAGSASLISANVNSVPVTYGYVTITAQFNADVDISRIVSGAGLHSNIQVTNVATGVAVGTVQVDGYTNSVLAVFDLDADTKYRLTLAGGINGLRSSTDQTQNLIQGRFFDGDGDGVAEAVDLAERFLTTAKSNGDSTAPPTVSGVSWNSSNRRFTVTFSVPSVSGDMDVATLIAANLSLRGSYSGAYYTITPKAIDVISDTQVYIYVPDRFYPASGSSTPYVSVGVVVSRNVMSEDGIKLDGNSDGIGGNTDDDYISSTSSIDSGIQ